MSAILELGGVRKSYGLERALDGLDLDLVAGEIHAIVGLNGAGKTTLMRAAVGMLRPDEGEVRVFGMPPKTAPPEVWGRVGHMIEGPAGYPELSVLENLIVWARLHGLSTAAAAGAARCWIDRLSLGRWEHRAVRTLSLGNRQRLGIACALVHAPGLVLLDEPTNALDPSGVILVRDALAARVTEGAGILVSSHHLDEVARIAHRISVVHAGLVVGTLQSGAVDLEKRFFEMVRAFDARRGKVS
jgi:ABC-2 type transport system ATP-binding protein